MDSKQLAQEPSDAPSGYYTCSLRSPLRLPCEGEKAKGVEHHATIGSPRGRRCERGIEAVPQGFAFRFIGTSRNIVGVAWMRISGGDPP